MKKLKLTKLLASVLTASLLLAGALSVSAQTPGSAIIEATPREFKDFAAATVDRDVDYNLSSLDLSTLPKYMEESLGFDGLEKGKKPISVTDLNVEDLYSFTTYNEDDTLTLYMFSEPVKFVDKSTEAIRFVDNTIKVASAEKQPPVISGQNELYTAKSYTNTANFFSVDMPASVNQGVSLSFDNLKFSLTPARASLSTASLKTARHRGMSEEVVEYRNALGDGVHLQYVPISNGVKENIILDRYPGTNKFEFIVDVGNYYPVYTEGESIPFADPATDEISLILGQADARDSYTGDKTDGHFTLYNSLKVKKLEDGRYALTVTIDKDFLTNPDTVYPVVIDPSYTVPGTSFRDTTVYSAKPTSSAYYSSAYLIVGDHGSSYGEGIAYIQTKEMNDYSYIQPHMVTYASYRVYEGSGKTNSSTIRLYGVEAPWDQTTITYNNRPDYDSGTLDSQTVDHSGWYSFNVTRHIRDFLNYTIYTQGKPHTCGFALAVTNTAASSKHFCSGEYTGNAKPSIIINYVDSVYDITSTYNSSGNYPFKAWGKLINNDAQLYRFNVNTAGTYVIETMGSSYFTNGQTTDTMIELFDSYYNRIVINDDSNTGNTTYSRIPRNLTAGRYHLLVSDADDSDGAYGTADSIGRVVGLKCYVIIEKQGELLSYDGQKVYSGLNDLTYGFYKIGNSSGNYMCYGYAVNDTNTTLVPNGSPEFVAGYIDDKGYTMWDIQAPSGVSEYVVAYKTGYTIVHYAKVVNGVISAKHGRNAVFMLDRVDAYFQNSSYGIPAAYYWKP